MLKITFLEGYAGLRLKENQPLEIKPGINLLVGKNGSGKSNLASLISYIYSRQAPTKRVFELPYLKKLGKEALKKFTERDKQPHDAVNIKTNDFGENKFCQFNLNGNDGNLSLMLSDEKNYLTFESELNDTQFNGNGFMISTTVSTPLKMMEIKPKIELDSADIYLIPDFRMFRSSDPNSQNPIILSIVDNFNNFFAEQVKEFHLHDEKLHKKIEELRESILKQYDNFFDQTDKKLHVTLDPTHYNGRALVLLEKDQTIGFDALSDGEKNLFNLIIGLATAKDNKPDLIIFDEPELFMHDDMIKTLVKEIKQLSNELPTTTVIVTTHSSVLIEELAEFGKKEVNLIAITNKEVFNSSSDIDFINVLKENGAKFSPLYLSKRPNLFIENIGESGEKHKQFLLSFFNSKNQPNIIPIGSSGQVKTYENYAEILEKIINTPTKHMAVGILDGDMWLLNNFSEYFDNALTLSDFITKLKNNSSFYIKDNSKENLFYLNCWEIENLYLYEELLSLWKKRSTNTSLTTTTFIDFLKLYKKSWVDSWLKTYTKYIFSPIYLNIHPEKYIEILNQRIHSYEQYESHLKDNKDKLDLFFDALIYDNLLNWLPGKEVYNLLKKEFDFSSDGVSLNILSIAVKIQSIIKN